MIVVSFYPIARMDVASKGKERVAHDGCASVDISLVFGLFAPTVVLQSIFAQYLLQLPRDVIDCASLFERRIDSSRRTATIPRLRITPIPTSQQTMLPQDEVAPPWWNRGVTLVSTAAAKGISFLGRCR